LRLAFLVGFLSFAPSGLASQLGPLDRSRAHDMLAVVKQDLQRHYFDSTFRGLDLDRHFQVADSLLDEAQSINRLFAIIARTVLKFEDSHTLFLPPSQTVRVRYGWELQMLGDSCYVTGIAPGSDAAAQGLKVGDRVLTIQGMAPDRSLLSLLDYLLYAISPVDIIQFKVESPAGEVRELAAASRVVHEQRIIDLFSSTDLWAIVRGLDDTRELHRNRFVELDSTLVWRLRGFDSEDIIDEGISRSRRFTNLVLDLRGNRGGYEREMLRLLGHMLERETVIDTLREREKVEVKSVRPEDKRFAGRLTVLVDSRSASAAEIVARVIQLEERGTVIGDRSAGAVMRSRIYGHRTGTQLIVPYAVSITNADVIFRDGGRLEGIGVTPDVRIVPTGRDIASGADPVLGEALRRLGYPIPPEGVAIAFPPHSLEIDSW
jgi:C-terminal processing protease CtpA/Prc